MKFIPSRDELPPEGDPIGPNCTFDASTPKSPTGFTWRELEEYRYNIAIVNFLIKGGVPNANHAFEEALYADSIPESKEYKSLKKKKEMIGLNFVAIDFETANNYRKSACSLGLAVVRDGEIVDSKYWLIKPEPLEVGFYQKKVHGLSLEDLLDKPSFHELWPEIAPYFEGQVLVCHNAGFDISVLSHLMAHYEIEFTPYDYFCTMSGARQVFPRETSYGLSYLAFKHSIDFVHHHALEDAKACAKLAVIMARHLEINSLLEFDKKIRQIDRQNKKKPLPVEEPSLPSLDDTHPFYQKQVVFTGTLQRLVRSDAKILVESVGGIFAEGLTKSTNYLVVGSWNPSFGDKEKSSKMVKAEKFVEAGSDLQVIDENYFMELFVS